MAPMPRSMPRDRFHDLIEAATAVFLEQGYRRTQMADVAARMGVAKGTVYLYVESKEALFDAVLRHAESDERIQRPQARRAQRRAPRPLRRARTPARHRHRSRARGDRPRALRASRPPSHRHQA